MACCGHPKSLKKAGPHIPSGKSLETQDYHNRIDKLAHKFEKKVTDWRHDIHQHPELSNREFRTSKLVADHLKFLKFDSVKTDIAPTGVVGVLKGGKPGKKVIALRADMDALPVKETVEVPFKSTQVDEDYPGGPFPVMHAWSIKRSLIDVLPAYAPTFARIQGRAPARAANATVRVSLLTANSQCTAAPVQRGP